MKTTENQHSSVMDVRAPVLFLLDMSGSMLINQNGKSRLDLLNELVVHIISECMRTPKARRCAEIAFMLFAHDIILDSDFKNIRWMDEKMLPPRYMRHADCGAVNWKTCRITEYSEPFQVPQFEVSTRDFGTDIGSAVIAAVDKLKKRVDELSTFGSYSPVLILISDGHPYEKTHPHYRYNTEAEYKAIQALLRHAHTGHDESNMIFPFVVGVGSDKAGEERLAKFAGHFEAGYFWITNDASDGDWKYLAQTLVQSINRSGSLNTYRFMNEEPEWSPWDDDNAFPLSVS